MNLYRRELFRIFHFFLGQQRMMIRAPLMRLHHELETFRNRAIADTHQTIQVNIKS